METKVVQDALDEFSACSDFCSLLVYSKGVKYYAEGTTEIMGKYLYSDFTAVTKVILDGEHRLFLGSISKLVIHNCENDEDHTYS